MDKGKCILVVEDNTVAFRCAKIILESYGCLIDHAYDGSDAIELVKKKKYDGIYMDIGLPTTNGIDACKAIRQYESENHLESVPIIAVTSNCSPEEIEEYLKVGMQEVIPKPFTKANAIKFLSICSR